MGYVSGICQFPRGYFRDVGFFLSFSTQYLNRLSKKSRVVNLANLAGKKKSTIQFYVKIHGYHVLICIFHVCEKKAVAKQQKNPSQQLDWFDNQKKATKVTPLNLERWKNIETAALRPFVHRGLGGKNLSHEKKGPWLVGIYRGLYMLPSYIGDYFIKPLLQGSRNLNQPGWLMESSKGC